MPFFTKSTALRHRDYRLLWIGLLISTSGSMMQNAAILWHIYEITHSALALGAVGLVRVVPVVGFSLISGVAADRFDRRKVMMLAQCGMALCAAGLGAVAYAKIQNAWPIYVLAGLSSSFGAFDLPARQAIVPSIVLREDLTNAFSLNATMFHASSVVGPALAGFILAHSGLAWAYWINAISFLAIVGALAMMNPLPKTDSQKRPEANLTAALEGLQFVRKEPIILSSMLLDFFATFFSAATALLPIYAKDILKVGPIGYGWLYAAEAVGALITAVFMSVMHKITTNGRILIVSVILYGIATILFGVSKLFVLSFLALALVGGSDTVSMVIRNTIRQINTPDELRGRMISINMIFFMGGPQLGELEAGLVASWFSAPISVVSGGIGCIVALALVLKKWPMLWRYQSEENQEDAQKQS
jgi:MFS family permease